MPQKNENVVCFRRFICFKFHVSTGTRCVFTAPERPTRRRRWRSSRPRRTKRPSMTTPSRVTTAQPRSAHGQTLDGVPARRNHSFVRTVGIRTFQRRAVCDEAASARRRRTTRTSSRRTHPPPRRRPRRHPRHRTTCGSARRPPSGWAATGVPRLPSRRSSATAARRASGTSEGTTGDGHRRR